MDNYIIRCVHTARGKKLLEVSNFSLADGETSADAWAAARAMTVALPDSETPGGESNNEEMPMIKMIKLLSLR